MKAQKHKEIKPQPPSGIKLFISKRSVQVAIIAAITFICYINTVFNEYSLDDQFITNNAFVSKGISGLKDIWTHSYAEYRGKKIDYRPISLTAFALEYSVFNKNVAVSHFINLLLYIISLVMLYYFCIYVFEIDRINNFLPFIIVLLFAVHPSHTEVIDSIKNRDEILSMIWILISGVCLYNAFKSDKTKSVLLNMTGFLLFLYISMLTKLVSLPFIASVFLWMIYKKMHLKKVRFALATVLSLAIIMAHLSFLRSFMVDRSLTFYENPLYVNRDFSMITGLGFNTIIFYLKFLFVPYPFRFYYGYNTIPFESINHPVPLLGMLVSLVLVGLLIYSLIRKTSYSYFLFAFLFCLFFYCNLLIPYTGIVAERVLFQVSFFFIAFIIILVYQFLSGKSAAGKNTISRKPLLIIYFYVAVIFIYSVLIINRNTNWKNEQTLFLHDMKYLENSAIANYLAGTNFYQKGFSLKSTDSVASKSWMQLSVYYLDRAILLADKGPGVPGYYDLAITYKYGLDDLENAEKNFLLFEKNNHNYKGLARDIASTYYVEGKYSEAIPYYEKGFKEENDPVLLFYLCICLFNIKQVDLAVARNEELMKKFPDTYYPYLNYGTYFMFYKKDTEKAIAYLEKAIALGNRDKDVISNVASYYTQKNNLQKADQYNKMLQ